MPVKASAGTLSRCDVLVAATFILAGALAWYAIYRRCKSSLVDVERATARRNIVQWYGTRTASVILVIGAFVHTRRALKAMVAQMWNHQ
jgi:hypothetical protein